MLHWNHPRVRGEEPAHPLEDRHLSYTSPAVGAPTASAPAAAPVGFASGAGPTRSDPAARGAGVPEALLDRILVSLDDDKAEDIVPIDLRGRSSVADYMVICSGRSSRQVAAIAEKLVERVKDEFGQSCKVEGKEQGDWVLIDTGDVVVHVFRPEVREFYQLEKMWLPGGVPMSEPPSPGSTSRSAG